jgi:hypothetical protein
VRVRGEVGEGEGGGVGGGFFVGGGGRDGAGAAFAVSVV